jgi:hypothetical protein
MIVSASYRTDIPAFYGQWFMARLSAGFARTVNPYGGQIHEVPLGRADVDGFVFWTRNADPFMGSLREINRQGYPFVVQFTVTGYPKPLERSVIDAERAIGQIREIAAAFGPHCAVWRYDPILSSDLTPPEWHLKNFADIARRLTGAVDEVVVSFVEIYRKTKRNLDTAARTSGFAWHELGGDEKHTLVAALLELARAHGIRLSLCTQPACCVDGADTARCIDAARLSAVAGREITARTKGNRPGCLCAESRDIGAYDTCPHGCVYCYAVNSRAATLRNRRAHDPASAFLIERQH